MMARMADRLGVRLLGEFRLDGVELDALRSRQARTLLKRLALERGGDGRRRTAWSRRSGRPAGPTQPDRDLHVLVSRARTVVGADRVVRRDGGYALAADWWDVDELASLARGGPRADAGDPVGARTAAEGALALVRGTPARRRAGRGVGGRGPVGRRRRRRRGTPGRRDARRWPPGQVGDAAAHATEALRHDPVRRGRAAHPDARARRRRPTGVGAGRVRHGSASCSPRSSASTRPRRPGRSTRTCSARTRPRPARPASHRARAGRPRRRAARAGRGAGAVARRSPGGAGQRRAGRRQDRAARPVGARPRPARGVVVLRGRAEAGRARAAAGPRRAGRPARRPGTRRVGRHAGGLPGPGATADALSLRVFAHLDDARPVAARGRGHRAAARRRRRRRPGDLGVARARPSAPRAAAAGRRRAPRPRRPRGVEPDTVARGRAAGRRRGCRARRRRTAPRRCWSAAAATRCCSPSSPRGRATHVPTRVPGTLREAVAGRLRRTGAAEPTLQAAAVLGATIDLDLLAAVLGAAPLEVLEHLDVGVRQAFLAEREGSLAFRHELVRLAVAAEAGRGPAGLAAPARRRAAADATGRDPARAGPARPRGRRPGARGRRAGARRRRRAGPGSTWPAPSGCSTRRSSSTTAARCGCGAAGCGCRAATWTAPTRTPRLAMATDETGEALELRAWVARNRHDLDGAIRLGRAAAAPTTDPTIRGSSLIAVAFGHRGNGDLRQAEAVLDEAARMRPRSSDCRPGPGCCASTRAGRPRRWPRSSRCSAPRRAAAAQGFWVEHTLQMTAHAYGLLGRSADALRVARPAGARDRAARHGGAVRRRPAHLPQLAAAQPRRPGGRGARAAPGSSWPAGQEILAQCQLDVADCLLRAGDLAGAAERLAVAEAESGTRWFHNKWRFDQRRGLLLRPARARRAGRRGRARRGASRSRPRPRNAATPATPCSAGWSGRPRRRGSGGPVDDALLAADLDPLAEVAALEGWWLAADVADATGSAHARATAARLAEHVAREAAEHGDGVPDGAPRLRLTQAVRPQAIATASTTTGANRSPVRRTASTASATNASRASAVSASTKRVQVRHPEPVAHHVGGLGQPDVDRLLGDRPSGEPGRRAAPARPRPGRRRRARTPGGRRTSRAATKPYAAATRVDRALGRRPLDRRTSRRAPHRRRGSPGAARPARPPGRAGG